MTKEKTTAAILFSGKGSNLKALLDSPVRSSVCVALTDNPTSPGIQYCQEHNVPLCIIDFSLYHSRALFEKEILRSLEPFCPDYIVLSGFMRIFSSFFVNHYKNCIINIHPSLLPSYKGLHTHENALKRGNTIHGVTIHFVTEELDAGPIIAQGALPIHPDDDPVSLKQRIHQLEHLMYPQVVSWILAGDFSIDPQGRVRTTHTNSFLMPQL